MPDQPAPGLPRIALVFGDEAAAAHIRAAIDGLAEIVYASSAADFDAARLADARVTAAVVNLDDGDWLEGIEASLEAAGVAVVYNDPDISRGLEGWARARWLRHLLAKLRQSPDVDPPRPAQAQEQSIGVQPETRMPPLGGAAVADRPLSPEEIETMTADFVAVSESVFVQVGEVAPQPRVVLVDAPPVADAARPAKHRSREADPDLDVDTETLSAMIDARLAGSESGPPSDSPEVWRVVETGMAAGLAPASEAVATATPTRESSAPSRHDAAPQDDTDVLASLPSLDDWQLVDGEAAVVPAAPANHEHQVIDPALSDRFAGLQLVPMETVAVVSARADPIERWLHEGDPAKAKTTSGAVEQARLNGGKR